jgi:hypothetical protein
MCEPIPIDANSQSFVSGVLRAASFARRARRRARKGRTRKECVQLR